MEAVPRMPMISFDLKTSPEHPAFGAKLKQYIAEFYHEDPESYNNEFHALEGLRSVAVRPARDVTGCSVMKRYYAQLHALQGRFPMGKGQPMAITFTWKDVYTSTPIAVNDIMFEMGAILYNIGALHTQLGAADSRNSADGMKLACTHFQCAAWCFQHLRENYTQLPSEDVCPEVLGYMVSLNFAQAQECILEKSMADNRKATIVARIAVQVVDYYSMALAGLLSGGDDGAVADTVGSKHYKEWKKYIQFKIAYCGSISLLYQGQQAEEQQKMGERVAFYQAAFNRLEEARKLSKGMNHPEAIAEALNFTNDVVEGKRKAARNENEFIYHEEVPEMSALTQASGAPLVKGIPFSVTDKDVLGEDIFKRLVPLSAHEASSVYSEEKAQLLRDVGARVEAADLSLQTHLSALHLQGLQPIDESIPQSLIDRCAALSARPDTTNEIVQAMDLLADTSNEVNLQLQEIGQLLEQEDANEKSYQSKMGNRPVNSVITELTREFSKYKEANAKAGGSNETLRRAMAMHVNNLQVLGQPLSELQAAMPRLREEDVLDGASKQKLQEILDKVDQMRNQRLSLYNQFRENALADDITAKLVAWGDKPAEELFQKELQKHKDTVALLDQNLIAQENILKALTEAYAGCAPFLKIQMEIVRKREHFCTSLVASYDAYEDLLSKMSKGTDFYKKLHTNVSKLLARVKSVSNVQQEERAARLQVKAPTVKPDAPTQLPKTSNTPKLKDYLAAGFGTDSYRMPGVRPRPLGSEGTTDTPIDKTPNAYVNPYYQGLSNMNMNPQIYQNQTDATTNYGMNYYSTDYGKMGTTQNIAQQPADKTMMSNYNNTMYNYPQYTQNMQSIPTTLPDQMNQSYSMTNVPSQQNITPNTSNNMQMYNQALNTNASNSNQIPSQIQSNYSVPQSSTYDNKQNYQPASTYDNKYYQNYNQNFTQDYNTQQQKNQAQDYGAPQKNLVQDYSTQQQNLTQDYSTPQKNLTQDYNTSQQSMTYNQNTISNTDGVTQQMSNLSMQNIPSSTTNYYGYNQTYQNQSEINKPVIPNAVPQQYNTQNSATDISQALSYSGHPGYSFNQNTGTYQYSSGYQNMQSANQPSVGYVAPSYSDQNVAQNVNPNEYWQQNYNYQYTNASGNLGTNNTLSSQTGYQGQSFAKQYSNPTIQQNAVPGQYYTQQYGTDVVASSASIPGYQMTPQSPMTYMNSSNNTTKTTYSQDQNTLGTNSVPLPIQSPSVQANVDLLAGLDFSSSVPTLTPQQSSKTASESKTPSGSKNLSSADISHRDVSTDSKVEVSQIKQEIKQEIYEETKIQDKEIESKLLAPPSKEDLLRFLQEVERQEKFLDGITTKTLNGPTPLETKWKELQDLLMLEQNSRSISVARCYPAKNRNPDYLPYDQTRVSLRNTNDDYINASYIKNLPALCPAFIVTQAPVNNSLADFWSMVWDENVETIVCLLTKKELDLPYFPLRKDSSEMFGDYKVTLQTITESDHCIERVMSIKGNRDKPPRDFVLLQILVPANNGEIIAELANKIVSSYRTQRSAAHPILVHCLTGGGISGIVMYTVCAILSSRTGKPCLLDTLNVCNQLCSQRKGMLRERQDMLLAMEAELHNAQAVLNENNLMTARQIQNKATNNIPPPQEVAPKDPFQDLDPMWQIRRKS